MKTLKYVLWAKENEQIMPTIINSFTSKLMAESYKNILNAEKKYYRVWVSQELV